MLPQAKLPQMPPPTKLSQTIIASLPYFHISQHQHMLDFFPHLISASSPKLPNPILNPQKTINCTTKMLNKKKAKGLCFHCDEKFTPGHKCQKKQVFMLHLRIDIDGIDQEEETRDDYHIANNIQVPLHVSGGNGQLKSYFLKFH